jgi:multidrug efflux pump subunit AcrA (membrane-fusion protein)
VDNGNGLIKPGLSADVDIIVGSRSNVVIVPRSTLIRKAGEIYVFIINNNVAEKRIVEPGYDDGINLQIQKGVKPGEIIANSDFNVLQDGLKVKAE